MMGKTFFLSCGAVGLGGAGVAVFIHFIELFLSSVPHDKTIFLATESDWRIFSHWY